MLTQERKGEIALSLLKEHLRRQGLRTFKHNEIRRDLGNLARATGIPLGELEELTKELLKELFNEAFPN